MSKEIKMLALSVVGIFFSLLLSAQSVDIDLTATMLKNYDVWKKGTEIRITRFVHETISGQEGWVYESFYLEDDQGNKVDISSKVESSFDFQYETTQQLWDACIVTNVLHSIVKNGFKYSLRREMENDALDYIQTAGSDSVCLMCVRTLRTTLRLQMTSC